MYLSLCNVMSWTGNHFNFREILNRGDLRFFLKHRIDGSFSGPHIGLYESKYKNFSEYCDEIFLDENDLCNMLEKKYGENIPADVVRQWLKMSPIQFIDFMNSGDGPVCSLEEAFRKNDVLCDGLFFKTCYLKKAGFTFHVIDWLSWQKERGGEGEAVNAAPQSVELESENKQLRGKQAELEQELAACREQLEKAQIEKPAPNARTSAATQARQEKKLTEWRGAFKVMLKVILQSQAEGPRSRTTPELENMCARHDYKPTGEQIKFLQECLLEALGSDYVNTTGGPTIQG